MITAARQIKNRQAIDVKLIFIGEPVPVVGTGPFFRKFRMFSAVESKSIVIPLIPHAERRLLDDIHRTVI